jgi:osmotically-inducible protein OsmY
VVIEAHRGVVTLSGRVASFYQRQLIHTLARRVAGVVQVIDQLEVDSPSPPDRIVRLAAPATVVA